MQSLLALLGVVIVAFTKTFLGWGRLKSIRLVPLEVTLDEVRALYGDPEAVEPREDWEGATRQTFQVRLFEVHVTEWQGRVHAVTYEFPGRTQDREFTDFLEFYGEGHRWEPLTEGYSHRRADLRRVAWCSAAPVIGVGTDVFLGRKRAVAPSSEDASAP
jgi:hypothetical protein